MTAAESAGCFVIAVPTLRAIEQRPGRLVVGSLRDLDLARIRAAWAASASPADDLADRPTGTD
jgi:beta-phosphoglucomutase-like phosphatase (HAD superfamily)